MTSKQKHRENIRLMALYDSFLMNTPLSFEDRIKINEEIARLSMQNRLFEQLTVSEYNKEYSDFTIKINSQWI
ncbi:hypothetical protein HN014_08020 [Aquimarina sp. TRL1]|uniref:hypothetical protein n=1 Tax=Aquimarina sp. (strain TRL1) TaxID=2736252 RepID=UPI00158E6758|nr:hypothetical protein [Aquimarina sp. TRL1]QKX04864.1 hypothetical protein HN014_08020 [Aquimarina sp. TRL1]